MGGETIARIYCVKKNLFSIKKKSGTMLKVYFSYLFPSHRAQAASQTPSILRDVGKQNAGTDISWTEKGALGYRKRP